MKRIREYKKILKTGIYTAYVPVYLKSRFLYSVLIGLPVVIFLLYTSFHLTNSYIKSKYLDLPAVKRLAINLLQQKLHKSVEFGVVDFSIFSGIIIEDVKVSAEEDFSSNKILFYSKRIDIGIGGYFSKEIVFKKITIHNANLNFDIDKGTSKVMYPLLNSILIKEVEFIDLQFKALNHGNIVFHTNRPIDLLIKRDVGKLSFSFNDNFLYIPATSTISGVGSYYLKEKKYYSQIELNKFNHQELELFNQYVLNTKVEKGFLYGFASFKGDEGGDFEANADLKIHSLKGYFLYYKDIIYNSLFINANFSYQSKYGEIEEKKNKIQGYAEKFKRKLQVDTLTINETIGRSINDLKQYNISISLQDSKGLWEKIYLPSGWKINGNLNFELNLNETKEKKNWFIVTENLSLVNSIFTFKAPNVKFKVDELLIKLNNKQELIGNLKGNLFGSPFNLGLSGNLSFNRAEPWGKPKFLYLTSNVTIDGKIQQVLLEDYESIYLSIEKYIQDSIRERQAKLLEEEYFITLPEYKTFLEELQAKINLKISNIKKDKNSPSLGPFSMNLDNLRSSLLLKVAGEEEKNKENEISYRIDYGRKIPYMDFSINLKDFTWGGKAFSICDMELYPEKLDINLAMVSNGNNLSEFLTYRSLRADANLYNVRAKQFDNEDLFSLGEYINENSKFNLALDLQIYSRELFYRNIEVKGQDYYFKGYANSKNRKVNYVFYGNMAQKPVKLSFIESKYSCNKN